MKSAFVDCENPELDLKEATIGMKVAGQGNKIQTLNLYQCGMHIPNLIWLRKFFLFEKLASASNATWMPSTEYTFMCFILQLLDFSIRELG